MFPFKLANESLTQVCIKVFYNVVQPIHLIFHRGFPVYHMYIFNCFHYYYHIVTMCCISQGILHLIQNGFTFHLPLHISLLISMYAISLNLIWCIFSPFAERLGHVVDCSGRRPYSRYSSVGLRKFKLRKSKCKLI